MKYIITIFSILILLLSSCKDKGYKPEGLTKLSDTEIIERARQNSFPEMEAVVFKNEEGEILNMDSIMKTSNRDEWAMDMYVDDSGNVVEVIFRKATLKDKAFQQEMSKAVDYQPPIELIDVDCEQKQEILQTVFDSDQNMRTNGETISAEVDRQNLTTVISLIEKCGMPTLEEVDEVQMSAIWAVFQHGDNANRKKYLPLLEQSAKNGDLKATQIAMMIDKTLLKDGEPQIYGTQVQNNGSEWVLLKLDKPETVNKRRAEMGFEPLQEYLNRWDIEFNVEQEE